MNGNPKMLPAQPGINAPRTEWIDINAMDAIDPVHFTRRPKLTECEFDYNQFSNENGDGEIV